MKNHQLTAAQEQCLRDQTIDQGQPGTVLRDFQAILDFVGPQGVESSGKYNLLPIKLIGELDSRLSRPLRLNLKRPQIRSHPYLQGLNLLLRASGLTLVEGTSARARLVVAPEMRVQWDELNPTEQYFNLLEAWLRFGTREMIGDGGSLWNGMIDQCRRAWEDLPKEGFRYDLRKLDDPYIPVFGRDLYDLALMDLFGLVEVEFAPRPVTPWRPAAVKHVLFGDAMFTLLPSWRDLLLEKHISNEQEDDEEEVAESPSFGAWQTRFQPYFPMWQNNLVFPEPEIRDGTFIFRVSLADVWRLIAMPATATLDDLVLWILRSVKFDDEHLYQLTYRSRMGSTVSVRHPACEESPYTDEVIIGELPLEPGQTMELLYDFGDEWHFTVKLERIEPPGDKLRAPRILESHGMAPKQYEDWDE